MAGHGGGGGGHGGGGGGSKKGLLAQGGCVRYLVLYVVALLLLVGFLVARGLGLLHLPGLPGPAAGAAITISSVPTPAAAQSGGSAPQNVSTSSQSGSTAPSSGSTSTGSTSGTSSGSTASAPPLRQLQSIQLPNPQGGQVTAYTFPPFYIVAPGDTLAMVSATYNVPIADLRTYNRLTSDDLRAGQILYLPAPTYNPVPNTGRNAGKDTNAPTDTQNTGSSP